MQTAHRKSRRLPALLASCLLLLASSAMAADPVPPAVLDQIPGDASAVLVIANVKDLGTKISNAATRLNVPFPLPPDLAGYALRNLGIAKGFDDAGSAALVLLKPLKAGDDVLSAGAPPAVIILPTTAAKDMLENFAPAAPDAAGISEVTLPGDAASKGYVSSNDHYVIFAQDKDILTAYLARTTSLSKTVSPEALKSFTDNDIVLWGNIAAIGPAAAGFIENLHQEYAGKYDLQAANSKDTDPTAAAVGKEVLNQYFLALKQYCTDADSAMTTLRLNDSGVTLGLAGSFKPGTPFASFVAAQKPHASPGISLKGLPSGQYLFAGAFSYDPKTVSTLVTSVTDAILKNETVAKDARIVQIKKTVDQSRTLVSLAGGASYVVLPSLLEGVGNPVTSTILIDSADPKKFLAALTDFLKNPLLQNTPNPDIKASVVITPGAITIKEIKLNKVHITYKLRTATADSPISDESKAEFKELIAASGKQGISFYYGIIGSRVAVILGYDQATLETSVDAALNSTDTLATDVQSGSPKDQVVPNTIAMAYLPVTRWIQLIQSVAAQHATPPTTAAADAPPPPPPANLVQDGPPIVMSAGITNTTLTTEINVPIQTLTSMMDAYKLLNAPKPEMTPAPQPTTTP